MKKDVGGLGGKKEIAGIQLNFVLLVLLTLCPAVYSKLVVRVSSYSYESRLCSLETANHAPWGCNQL